MIAHAGSACFFALGARFRIVLTMLPSLRRLLLASSLALALGSAACASSRASSPPAEAAPSRVAMAAAATKAVPPGHLDRIEVDRVLVTQGPPWVLRRVMTEEVMGNDGKFSGWRLVGLSEEWSGIDIKPGDVVTRVNGLPLERPEQFWDAWKAVATAAEVTITVIRDGTARQVTLPIDGAPSAETAKTLLERDTGPQRAREPARPSILLDGPSAEEEDHEVY
jgi:hypothetical protein